MVELNKNILRQYIPILAVVLPLVMGIVWLMHSVLSIDPYLIGLTGSMTTFDSRLWKAGEHREDMVINLLMTHKLIGLTHREVSELLGEEQPPIFFSKEYRILLRNDFWLMITYDNGGRVSKVRIEYCGS